MSDDKEPPSNNDPNMKRFVVKKWCAVALWGWDGAVDLCPICRNPIYDDCIECQASEVITLEQCMSAKGVCGHIYHYHCIAHWLRDHSVCPLDNKKWDYQSYGQ